MEEKVSESSIFMYKECGNAQNGWKIVCPHIIVNIAIILRRFQSGLRIDL